MEWLKKYGLGRETKRRTKSERRVVEQESERAHGKRQRWFNEGAGNDDRQPYGLSLQRNYVNPGGTDPERSCCCLTFCIRGSAT